MRSFIYIVAFIFFISCKEQANNMAEQALKDKELGTELNARSGNFNYRLYPPIVLMYLNNIGQKGANITSDYQNYNDQIGILIGGNISDTIKTDSLTDFKNYLGFKLRENVLLLTSAKDTINPFSAHTELISADNKQFRSLVYFKFTPDQIQDSLIFIHLIPITNDTIRFSLSANSLKKYLL